MNASARFRPLDRARRGQSLLELTLAVTIVAGTLVPALRLIRQALEQSREIETRNLMVSAGVSQMEQHVALVCDNWSTGNFSGNLTDQGRPEIRYFVSRSDSTLNGGIPDQLMAVNVTVWHDTTSNGARDSGESYVSFASKAAKLAGY